MTPLGCELVKALHCANITNNSKKQDLTASWTLLKMPPYVVSTMFLNCPVVKVVEELGCTAFMCEKDQKIDT